MHSIVKRACIYRVVSETIAAATLASGNYYDSISNFSTLSRCHRDRGDGVQ